MACPWRIYDAFVGTFMASLWRFYRRSVATSMAPPWTLDECSMPLDDAYMARSRRLHDVSGTLMAPQLCIHGRSINTLRSLHDTFMASP